MLVCGKECEGPDCRRQARSEEQEAVRSWTGMAEVWPGVPEGRCNLQRS